VKKLRQEFADTMLEVGDRDPRLVVLVGDISHGILQPYAKMHPARYYNVGICEPTIVNMAAGLARTGLLPVVHTIAPFIIERSYEQIKLDFGYQQLAVTLISVGGAFDYSQLGCSHHCYTDVSLISHLDRGRVVCPGSPIEFNMLFNATYTNGMINYFRLPEHAHGVSFAPEQIEFGKGIRVRAGSDLTIVTMGYHLASALEAATELAGRGIDAEILYLHTLKPVDAELIRASVVKTRRVLTVEELSAHDGLFNQVLRAIQGVNDVHTGQIAVTDFIHGYGSFHELCEKVDLTPRGIISRALLLSPASV
jgi:transketolase